LANLLDDPTVPAPYSVMVQHCADSPDDVQAFADEHDVPVVSHIAATGSRHTTATVRISRHVEYINVHIGDPS
jgi:hypothetical protein